RIDFDDVVPIATAPGEKPTVELGNFPAESRLMQYTGLRDKNGVEIYEGDVVEWQGGRFEVHWHRGSWYVSEPKGGPLAWLSDCTPPQCTIIGNIYEHPELIEAEPA